ncbi:NfeD family protein [Schlesneria paludicola]|uniref:NfeD family protein n=1 Tax=Schlesneria paludicola TaxID=360056 RepID=UPI00029AB21E|nr:NfeD family protein [Schlesneria paludicola]
MDSNAIFAILLLFVGLAILVAEIFVPSGGLLGVITFISLLVSLVFAYRAWGVSHPNVFGVFCILLLLLVPTVISFGFYLLPRTKFGKKVLLEAPEPQDLTPYAKESSRLEKLIGQFGTTITTLNPGGLVKLDGQRLHALSEGLSVEPGAWVQIVAIRGASVVVRPGTPPARTDSAVDSLDTEFDETAVERGSSLDFEFPPTT